MQHTATMTEQRREEDPESNSVESFKEKSPGKSSKTHSRETSEDLITDEGPEAQVPRKESMDETATSSSSGSSEQAKSLKRKERYEGVNDEDHISLKKPAARENLVDTEINHESNVTETLPPPQELEIRSAITIDKPLTVIDSKVNSKTPTDVIDDTRSDEGHLNTLADSSLELSAQKSPKLTPTIGFGFSSFTGETQSLLKALASKKSFLDEPSTESKDKEDSETEESAIEETTEYVFQTIPENMVQLEENLITGEEDENIIYQAKSKLYSKVILSKEERESPQASSAWKEKGLGILHLNESNESPSKIRLIMRAEGTFKLLLNCPILSTLKFEQLQDRNITWITIDPESEKPIAYLLRMKNALEANDLLKILQESKPC